MTSSRTQPYVSVYCATNRINGKSYIGICTITVCRRWGKHRQAARSTHPKRSVSSALHAAIRKYGVDAFDVVTLHRVNTWQEACEMERKLIVERGTFAPGGYNLTLGGDGAYGLRQSQHAKDTASRLSKGRKYPPDVIERMKIAHKLSNADPAVRARISKSLTGIKRSEETKRKDSEAAKARWLVPGYREKYTAAKKGRKLTGTALENVLASHKRPERNAKLSAALKGKPLSPEHIAKLRGRKRTPEQCRRIAEATKQAALEGRGSPRHVRALSSCPTQQLQLS